MLEKTKNLNELRTELLVKGIDAKGNKKRIVELARAAIIDLKKTYKKIRPDWVGEPKGMLQILFERGFIDPLKYDPRRGQKKDYTIDGKKDGYGNLIGDSIL